MGITEALVTAQRARFAAIDPLLPEAAGPPEGEPVDAATADGTAIGAILHHHEFDPDSTDLLWSAAQVWQLFPFVGDTGTEGMDALLRALRSRLDGESPAEDSACLVNWPSRDAEAIRAFLDHGMIPNSALAVRTAPPEEFAVPDGVTVRHAGPADYERVLDLTVLTFDYTGLVGSARREDAAAIAAPWIRRALDSGAPVWVAERGGEVVAAAECAWVESTPDSSAGELLPPGWWGYVNNVVTTPTERGGGIGRALMGVAHTEFHEHGARGTYLYYNPPSPLASVFWHRQGYRPLWTLWEVRPAWALR